VKALTLSSGRRTQVDSLLSADLNRHHVLWGGTQASKEAGGTDEVEPMIDFMQEDALTSLLPAGMGTWEHYNGSTCSTVDVVLAARVMAYPC
jgi:hypothetical protein